MIAEIKTLDTQILSYVRAHYQECPYLYMNLKKYGLDNPNVSLWADVIDDTLNGVYLRYFDCLHFYSEDDAYPVETLCAFIDQTTPQRVL